MMSEPLASVNFPVVHFVESPPHPHFGSTPVWPESNCRTASHSAVFCAIPHDENTFNNNGSPN